jgi:hypothetical protein
VTQKRADNKRWDVTKTDGVAPLRGALRSTHIIVREADKGRKQANGRGTCGIQTTDSSPNPLFSFAKGYDVASARSCAQRS